MQKREPKKERKKFVMKNPNLKFCIEPDVRKELYRLKRSLPTMQKKLAAKK